MRLGLVALLVLGAHATQQKVFSIGDLHGDYDRFKMILERLDLANFTHDGIHWTGGNSILVSTGDTVDRGEHGRPIYLAFQELARQAPQHGGEVVNILGNHELLNLQGRLHYVNPKEMSPHGDYGGRQGRAEEWSLNGVIGQDLRNRYVAAAVRQGTLFVHGGLDPSVLQQYGSDLKALDGLNSKVRQLLDSEVVGDHELFRHDGPFWNRFFAEGDERRVCKEVEKTLSVLGADRMVLGHTPQEDGVNVRCQGPAGPLIVLGDTLISRAYGPFGQASAVEYDGNNVSAIYFPESQETIRRVPLSQGNSLDLDL